MKKHFLPNQPYALLLLVVSVTSCNPQNKTENTDVTEQTTVPSATPTGAVFGTNPTAAIDDNIRSIYQDNNGIYWFGKNATGVYRYAPNSPLEKH